MTTITLISTIHEQKGPCNVSTLHEILVRAQPEVIFMEIPPFCLEQFFNEKTRSTLETDAVNQYLEAHQADTVAVDVMEATGDLIAENQRLCRELRARSREYSYLVNTDSQYIAQHGFAYLNSKYCAELWLKLDAEINITLKRIGNSELMRSHKAWTEVHRYREVEMIKNIQNYTETHTFNSGVFLLGAAHRLSIMQIATSHFDKRASSIQWNFGDYVELIDGWRIDAAVK